MNESISLPVMVANNVTLAKATLHLWHNAIFTVKEAQEKFLTAYRASVNDAIPGWEATWQTDPYFPKKLTEVEDFIKALCQQNGMNLTTFTRYRRAARATILCNIPFSMGNTFSLVDIHRIKKGETSAQAISRYRRQKTAETVLAKYATVLPLPTDGQNSADYIESIGHRLTSYFAAIQQQLGEEVVKELAKTLRRIPVMTSQANAKK
jgi:hypothetical protein